MSARYFSSANIAAANRFLQGAPPQHILWWAAQQFRPRLALATAFGAEGCCLIHMLAEIEPTVQIFHLETGYQFPETLELRKRLEKRYGITVELVHPDLTAGQYETKHGGPLYRHRPNQCCYERKIVPLWRVLAGSDARISPIRRDQTPDRDRAQLVQWDGRFDLVKVKPLLNWTRRDVWKFIRANDVPYNSLHDRGYPSIGCWPCTGSVAESADERAGRQAVTGKQKCGLHVIEPPE
jgi:phosphoadenosine phosphosulfate reductase